MPYPVDLTGLLSGFATAVINPEGEVSVQVTDGLGRTIHAYNGEGHRVSTRTYDALSDGTETTDLGTAVPAGLLITATTDAVNSRTAIYHDGVGRLRFAIDAENHYGEMTFDANNNRLTQFDANGVGQTCVYDFADRETSCTDTANDTTSSSYDAHDMVTVATDGLGKDTVATYDVRDRKITVLDRLLGITRFTYDDNNNLASIMDADADPANGGGGETTDYAYDERDLLIFESFPGHDHQSARPGWT